MGGLLVLLAAVAAGAASPGGAPDVDEVVAILRTGDGARPEQRVARLVALGPDGIPALCAVLTGQGLDETEAEPVVARPDELLLRALRELEPRSVCAFLQVAATGRAPLERRLVALRVLEELGDRAGVPVWIATLEELDPVHLLRPYVRGPAEAALASILRRDPRGQMALVDALDDVERPLLPLVAAAVGRAGRPDGADVLERLLGRDPELDVVAIEQIGDLAQRGHSWRAELAVEGLRRRLSGDDGPRVRAACARALGQARDVEAFEGLLALCDDPDRRTALAAGWALERLAGRRWPADQRDAALEWYRARREAWEAVAERLGADLAGDDPARVITAARELVEHPLFAHRAAELATPALAHREPEVASAVCGVLARLGSPRPVPDLVAALARDEPGVRRAAAAALAALTGETLPPDATAWRAALGL